MPPPLHRPSSPTRTPWWRRLQRLERRSALGLLVCVIMVGYGVFWMVPAAALGTAQILAERDWPAAQGEVISYDTRTTRSGRGRTTVRYHPEVRYVVDGRTYVVVADQGRGEPPTPGDPVEVRYPTGRPAEGRVAGDTLGATIHRGLSSFILIVGAGAVGFVLFRTATRRRGRPVGLVPDPQGWPPPGWTGPPTSRR